MEKPIINFEKYELPFLDQPSEICNNEVSDDNFDFEEDKELTIGQVKENMESRIPNETIYLGSVEAEIENWTNWNIQDDYYIYPLNNDKYDWALFRISWDDNWERWDWSFDARLKGYKENYRSAAKFILIKLWENWQIDLESSDNECYIKFLSRM